MPIGRQRSEITIGRNSPAWMVSYSDLVSQLLVFFVMFFALSPAVSEDQLIHLQKKINKYIRKKNIEYFVKTYINVKEGLVITFPEKYMFDSGSAVLHDEAKTVIMGILELVKDEPNRIAIEGHTDNIPISTKEFPSNWELSTARATNVLRFIVEKLKFDPKRLTSAGYGENFPDPKLLAEVIGNRPVTEIGVDEWKEVVKLCNDSEGKRAMNRRVDIVIKRLDKDEVELWRKKARVSPAENISKKNLLR